jgi:hypothetical protein
VSARRIEGEEHDRVMEDWHRIIPPYEPPTVEEREADAADWDRRKRLEEGAPDDDGS